MKMGLNIPFSSRIYAGVETGSKFIDASSKFFSKQLFASLSEFVGLEKCRDKQRKSTCLLIYSC